MFDAKAAQLWNRFLGFLSTCYGLRIEDASENPHFLSFLEFLSGSTSVHDTGEQRILPIRKTLVQRVYGLRRYLRRQCAPFQLTNRSICYAEKLARTYRYSRPGARSVSREQVEALCASLDERQPRQLRLKTAALLIWHAWARPNEILSRSYPRDLDATYRGGIVVILTESKTNVGERPEFFFIRHEANPLLCPVCCLHRWIEWLGPSYNGPLFPAFHQNGAVKSAPYPRKHFSIDLSAAFFRAGVRGKRYTSYSLRKGQATEAAANRMKLRDIQTKLRHRHFSMTLRYIDVESLFELMESPL